MKSSDPSNNSTTVLYAEEDAIRVALEILDTSGRYAASAHLLKCGLSFKSTVRILAEPLRRRKTSRIRSVSA
jgi:hypothetical protein